MSLDNCSGGFIIGSIFRPIVNDGSRFLRGLTLCITLLGRRIDSSLGIGYIGFFRKGMLLRRIINETVAVGRRKAFAYPKLIISPVPSAASFAEASGGREQRQIVRRLVCVCGRPPSRSRCILNGSNIIGACSALGMLSPVRCGLSLLFGRLFLRLFGLFFLLRRLIIPGGQGLPGMRHEFVFIVVDIGNGGSPLLPPAPCLGMAAADSLSYALDRKVGDA